MKQITVRTSTGQWMRLAALGVAALTAHAQNWVRFVEYKVQVDNRDRLTIHQDGRWEVSGDGSSDPYGLGTGNTKSGSGFALMTPSAAFPSPWWLDHDLQRWNVEVIGGQAPRCPTVQEGSNPDRTISVISHTDDAVVVYARDDGGCNSSGRVTCTVRVSYMAPGVPFFTRDPVGMRVAEGQRVELSCAASGGALNYAWRHRGVPIPTANQATLVIPAAHLRHAGDYDVVVTNPVGTVTSAPARLEVVAAPVKLSIRRLAADWVEVSWNTVPEDLYSVQWSSDFQNWYSSGNRRIGTGATLAERVQVIPGLTEVYRVLVEPE